jgi:hypothetical protein
MQAARTLSVVFIVVCGSAISAAADDRLVELSVAGGRQYHGVIDPSSNQDKLVLRTGRNGITLLRPIAWDRIVAAKLDGDSIDPPKLKEMVGSGLTVPDSGRKRIELRDAGKVAEASQKAAVSSPPQQIVSVSFDAFVANWDQDVEMDGLVVELAAVDAKEFLAACEGTVEIELFAPQRRVFHHAPRSGGDTLELVERWSRSIAAQDFGKSNVRLRLPFGTIHPELDADWLASSYGLVHVRVAIPGHGVFDASQDGVRIRPWAPNRDNLEMNAGRRFVPTEGLGRYD